MENVKQTIASFVMYDAQKVGGMWHRGRVAAAVKEALLLYIKLAEPNEEIFTLERTVTGGIITLNQEFLDELVDYTFDSFNQIHDAVKSNDLSGLTFYRLPLTEQRVANIAERVLADLR